jgi:hypothetical protein
MAANANPDFSGLEQADLSTLRLQDMTPAQRAELLRRYTAFVKHFGATPEETETKAPVRKWIPGERG